MPAVVAPVFGFFSAIASTTIGSIALNLLSSVALSALSRALAPDAKPVGIRTENTLSGGITPEAFMLGASATGGTFVCPPMSHGNAGKTPNAFLTYVIELAGIPGHQLDGLILNGERVEILTDSPHADYGQRIGGTYDGKAWIRYRDGTQTTADAMLLAKYPAPFVRPWSADMIGTGICYAVLTFQYDREVFQGWPQCRFELSSVPLYDPRRDSTAGGSGAHRWGQPATYEPSNNVAVQLYNAKRGLTFPSGDVWGGGIPAEDLPLAAWLAEMDACDDLVDDGNGGTEPAFRSGIEVQAADEPFSVIEELLKACMGAVAETGGVWTLRTGAPRLPVLFISDDDIIADEPEDFAPFPPIDQIFNAITGTHPDPAALWESRESELLTNAAWEAEDGGRRLQTSLSLPTVPYPVQVDRICAALIKDHRRMRRHVLTLDTPGAVLEAGDTLAWTSAANSYTAKLFEVTELSRDLRTQLVRVSLREVDPGDYDVPEGLVRPNPPLPDPVRPSPQGVPGFAVSPYILEVAGEPRRAGILVQWDPEAADDARGVRIAVRRAGDTSSGNEQPLYQVAAGAAVIVDGLVPGPYEVRAKFRVNRPTLWAAWTLVTVADVRLGLADLTDDLVSWLGSLQDWLDGGLTDLPGDLLGLTQAIATEAQARADGLLAAAEALDDEAQARADAVAAVSNDLSAETAARVALAQEAADATRAMRDRIRAVASEVAELGARNHTTFDELRRSISVQVGDIRASFDEQIITLINDATTLAARVTTIEAEAGDLAASIVQVDQARIDGDEALAQQIAALSVGTNTQFDQAVTWYWDSSVDGWTGTPNAPSVIAAGWLRPGAGSYVQSPAALAIDGVKYSQVRGRIRAVGTPVWLGHLYWAAEGEAWDVARRVSIDEPIFDEDNAASITWTPEWSGVVDRFRLDLADGGDETNYYEIDWIAPGRPAPGASSAELLEEKAARIAADEAEAAARTLLQAQLNDAEGVAQGAADAVEDLDVRVTATEGGLTSVASRTGALEATVDNPATGLAATAAALEALHAQVEALDDGSQVLLAEFLRSLSTSLRRAALEAADAGARNQMQTQEVREYLAEASQTLTTRIDATDTSVAVIAQAVTVLQAAIPGLATADALSALSTQVTDQGNILDTLSTAFTTLSAQVGDLEDELALKASASALTALSARVTTAENNITSISTAQTALNAALTNLTNTVATKASASALSDLAARVTSSEDQIDTLSAAQTSLAATVATKASTAALNTLTSRVTAAEGNIASISASVTSLTAQLGDLEDDVATKASAAALTALQAQVTEAEGEIDSLADLISSLTATVAGKADASALSALTARVTSAEGTLTSLSSAVTALTAQLGDLEDELATKASASALSALDARVTTAEGTISSQSSSIVSLNATLTNPTTGLSATRTLAEGKGKVFYQTSAPATSERLSQNLWVDTTGGANTPKRWNGSAWVAVTDKVATDAAAAAADALAQVATKASADAVNALTARVNSAEGDIDVLAAAQTTLSGQIAGKADASVVSALQAQVTEIDGEVASLAGATTVVQASLQGSNLIANGSFAAGLLTGWANVAAGMSVSPRGPGSVASVNAPTPFALQIAQSASDQSADAATAVPVTAGELLRAALKRASSGGTRNVTLQVVAQFLDVAGAAVGSPQVLLATTTGATAWAEVVGEPYAVPAGAVAVTLRLVRVGGGAGVGWVTALRVERDGLGLDAITASGLFRMEALAGPGGGTRLAFVGRTSVAEAYREAGLYIDVPVNPAEPSRVAVAADQFAIFGEGGTVSPFIVVGGAVYVSAALIRLTGDTEIDGTFAIKSGSSGERVEMDTGGVRVYDSGGTARVKIGLL